MQKTGGFKLAIEKRRNYYFEVSAIVTSLLLLVLIVYSVIFATKAITSVFNNKEVISAPNTVFDLEKANSIEKIKNFPTNDFSQTIVTPQSNAAETFDVSPSPKPSVTPAFSPII